MKYPFSILPFIFLFLFTNSANASWVFAYEDSKIKDTDDHHCSSNCRGEPTKTQYTLEITAEKSTRVRNPKLRCIKGPCGGWNSIISIRIVDKGTKAIAVFDVWSKPTTWVLSVDVYEKE